MSDSLEHGTKRLMPSDKFLVLSDRRDPEPIFLGIISVITYLVLLSRYVR